MIQDLPTVRRIVTGVSPAGKSRIVADGPAPATFNVPERPGCKVSNVWVTQDAPVPVAEPDGTGSYRGLHPPGKGTVIRIMDIPPEEKDPERRAAAARATAAAIFPDIHRVAADRSQHPGMHTTDTVDYAIVLEGEIYAVMEENETLMRTGDILVQRGTNHAWSNRSDRVCRLAFILIDGKR
jgi:mannose-6-phosphate isomerase-like protein (cupin superfamily)